MLRNLLFVVIHGDGVRLSLLGTWAISGPTVLVPDDRRENGASRWNEN
jgi:hypothetical protein